MASLPRTLAALHGLVGLLLFGYGSALLLGSAFDPEPGSKGLILVEGAGRLLSIGCLILLGLGLPAVVTSAGALTARTWAHKGLLGSALLQLLGFGAAALLCLDQGAHGLALLAGALAALALLVAWGAWSSRPVPS